MYMSWTAYIDNEGDVRVRFVGHLDVEGGVNSANKVLRLLDGQARELVLDVVSMTSHDRSARLAWQALLWDHRGLIRRIVMIGGTCAVRISGNVIARYLGVPLSFVQAERSVRVERLVEGDVPVQRSRAASDLCSLPWEITRPLPGPLWGAE